MLNYNILSYVFYICSWKHVCDVLVTIQQVALWGKNPQFVAFAVFHDVNTPTIANFKPQT